MAQAVVCPACGAKIKAGRPSCLRCGEQLAAAEAADAPVVVQTGISKLVAEYRGPILAAGIVLPLALLVIAVARQPPAYVPPTVSEVAKPAAPLPATHVTDEIVVGAVPNYADMRFFDADRAGRAVFNNGDFGSAIEQYLRAVEKNPKDLASLNNLGQALVRVGRVAEAVPYFERAIALNRSEWAPRFNLAHAYGVMNDWPKAVDGYRAAAAVFPEDYVTHYNLGLALHKAGQEEAAIPEFQKAIDLAPGEPSFHLSLGISYERLKKQTEAVQAYEDYLTMAPDAPDAGQVKSHLTALKKPA